MRNFLIIILAIISSCSHEHKAKIEKAEQLKAEKYLKEMDQVILDKLNETVPDKKQNDLAQEMKKNNIEFKRENLATVSKLIKTILLTVKKTDIDVIQDDYTKYLKNKNNMRNNYELFVTVNDYQKQYKKGFEEVYGFATNIYNKHRRSHKLLSKFYNINNSDDYIRHLTSIPEVAQIKNDVDKLMNTLNSYKLKMNDLQLYSAQYEAKKLGVTYPKNGYRECFNDDIWWNMNINKKMQSDCLYNVNGALEALQLTDGGVLLTGRDIESKLNGVNIFLYTGEQYVDGEILFNKYMVYVNNYSYLSLTGRRTVQAFREVNLDDYYFLFRSLRQ